MIEYGTAAKFIGFPVLIERKQFTKQFSPVIRKCSQVVRKTRSDFQTGKSRLAAILGDGNLVTREIMSKLVLHGRVAEGGSVYIETGNLSTWKHSSLHVEQIGFNLYHNIVSLCFRADQRIRVLYSISPFNSRFTSEKKELTLSRSEKRYIAEKWWGDLWNLATKWRDSYHYLFSSCSRVKRWSVCTVDFGRVFHQRFKRSLYRISFPLLNDKSQR